MNQRPQDVTLRLLDEGRLGGGAINLPPIADMNVRPRALSAGF